MDGSRGAPLSMAHQPLLTKVDVNLPVEVYFKQHPNELVERLSRATLPIFNKKSQINGSCILTSNDLVLTSSHTLDGKTVQIGPKFGTVVFLGSEYKLDFAILQLNEPIAAATPLELDIEPGIGISVQIYFDATGKQWVRQFESEMLTVASRSNRSLATTQPGESGSGRMLLLNGCVHSIHQGGGGEALKVIDIFNVLKSVAENPGDPNYVNASIILKKIKFRNLEYLGISQSTVALEVGAVTEEKPPVKDKITLDKPNQKGKKPEKISFDYIELRLGHGLKRGIKINVDGLANTEVEYAITPDPHKYAAYNKDPSKFYNDIAIEFGKYYLINQQFPPNGHLNVINVDFTFTRP